MEMKKYKLGEIASFIGSGMTPLRSNENYWNSKDYPWLKTEQLGEYQIFDTNEYISKVALEETNLKLFPKNTLSVAMYGEGKTRGNVSILAEQMTTNQACCNIIVDNKFANYKFVYYWLKNSYYKLRSLSSGIRNNLNSEDIKKFEINLPSLPTQQKIAAVLSSLDDKLALNKKINAKLEAMAKRLYDYWFVQFDYPDKNGKPYKTSGGKMVWNEVLKRKIPEGWEVGNLYEIADYINGLACQNYRPQDEEIFLPVIKIKEMHEGITSDTEKVSATIPEKYIIFDGDILFSWSATLEVMIWTGGKGGLNQHIFKVVPKSYFTKEYVFQQLSSYIVNFQKMAEARKTTMGHITSDHINQSRIVIPPKEVINAFSEKTLPIFNYQLTIQKEIQKLTDLRDRLLPLLMNGQVEVE